MLNKLYTRRDRINKLSRTVDVGWILKAPKAEVIWYDPEPFRQKAVEQPDAKSVQKCPASIDFDSRHYVIRCPYDLHLRLGQKADGAPQLLNVQGANSAIRPSVMSQIIVLHPKSEWRQPDRPLLQIVAPYVFISDQPVWINQLPPYLDYLKSPRPGLMISGRFPIHIWPRPFMWAFEWCDTSQDLILRRGEPWFYVRFETEDPNQNVRLFEAERTPELDDCMQSVLDVSNYTNRTYSLFRQAEMRRPERLLVRKTK